MKLYLLKHSLIGAAITMLFACGEQDKGFSFDINADSPVELNSDTLDAKVSEESGIQVIDLLEGVTSEGVALNKDSTSVFLRNFAQLNVETVPIALPQGSILKRGQTLEVDTDAFGRLLNWDTDNDKPETVTYSFEYVIDNGSETPVTRTVDVTIEAIFDDVTDLSISQPDNYEIPAQFPVKIGTTITPLYATDPSLTFSTADASVLEVGATTGIISGKKIGTTTLTVTPNSNPELAKTITVKVIPDSEVTDPVALQIADGANQAFPNAIDMADCTSYPMHANLLPLASNFERNVQWTSSDELKAVFTSIESGVLQVDEIFEGTFGTISVESIEPVSLQKDSLTVRLKNNYLCNNRFNNNFDHTETGPFYDVTIQGNKKIWADISNQRAPDLLEVVANEGITGNALHFKSTGESDAGYAGSEWNAARTPIPVEIGQPGYRFKLTAWVKNNTDAEHMLVTQLRYYYKDDGTKWENPAIPMLNESKIMVGDHWQLVEWEFDSQDWGTDDIQLQVYFKAGEAVDVYFDNFALYEIPAN